MIVEEPPLFVSALSQTQRRGLQYKRSRLKLIEELGNKCERCPCAALLEFDHQNPADRTWEARKTSRWSRLARYRREASEDKIQLLCRSCNAKKGTYVPTDEPPF